MDAYDRMMKKISTPTNMNSGNCCTWSYPRYKEWVSESRYGFSVTFKITTIFFYSNNSERPVDALAVKKGESLTDNLKSRDASASKKVLA